MRWFLHRDARLAGEVARILGEVLTAHLVSRSRAPRGAAPAQFHALRLLSAREEPAVVVQVGASSGREIAWLAERHPRHLFIGTDIFPEVVAFAAGRHRFGNLAFEQGSAAGVVAVLGRFAGRPAVVFASGSLQYVQPEHILRMFESLAGRSGTEFCL